MARFATLHCALEGSSPWGLVAQGWLCRRSYPFVGGGLSAVPAGQWRDLAHFILPLQAARLGARWRKVGLAGAATTSLGWAFHYAGGAMAGYATLHCALAGNSPWGQVAQGWPSRLCYYLAWGGHSDMPVE